MKRVRTPLLWEISDETYTALPSGLTYRRVNILANGSVVASLRAEAHEEAAAVVQAHLEERLRPDDGY